MIWNNQILDFVGYEMEDGTILGDPTNVDLTNAVVAVIDLGWMPPQPRSRWDLLPVVTMAEGDKPDSCPFVQLSRHQSSAISINCGAEPEVESRASAYSFRLRNWWRPIHGRTLH